MGGHAGSSARSSVGPDAHGALCAQLGARAGEPAVGPVGRLARLPACRLSRAHGCSVGVAILRLSSFEPLEWRPAAVDLSLSRTCEVGVACLIPWH